MAGRKMAEKGARKAADEFTEEERAAMKERVRELRARPRGKGDGERDVLAKIVAMQPGDRVLAERLHAIIKAHAPVLSAKTWYGMPAYARDDQVVCFFQPAEKFKARYATLGFSDKAKLDEGRMWSTSFALTKLGAAEESRVAALVKKAVG